MGYPGHPGGQDSRAFHPQTRKGQGKKHLGESSGGPEMFCILRSEKLNESLQGKKNYIPFPMASAYEKGREMNIYGHPVCSWNTS